MASSSPSPVKLILLPTTILSSTLFFLFFPPHHQNPSRLLLQSSSPPPSPTHCSFTLSGSGGGGGGGGLLNYSSLHFCLLSENTLFSLPLLSLLLLFHFYALVRTASDHFSPVVARLSSLLRLSPSMAAVTLLALGNGAPDLFASAAALRRGHSRTGLAAILSAGAFVSAFVVGSIAVLAAPFPLDPAPFVRDVFFYLIAASGLFYVYLSAEIYLWQAVGLIGFYVFFVVLVFWMDLGGGRRGEEEEEVVEMGLVVKDNVKASSSSSDWDAGKGVGDDGQAVQSPWGFFWMLGKVCYFCKD